MDALSVLDPIPQATRIRRETASQRGFVPRLTRTAPDLLRFACLEDDARRERLLDGLHADAGAETSARSINARDYTVGHHIAFGTGQFAPGTGEGNRLLAHELSHVVQQAGEQSTIMRVCDCASFGGRQPDPTDPRETGVSQAFPGLVSGDWCVIEPSTPTYNCFAWSVPDKTQWLDPVPQIDNLYGNGDGRAVVRRL